MSSSEPAWSIRSLLNPVVVRLLIYGVNPFDLERVLRRIEQTPFRNGRQLEAKWLGEWEALAEVWRERSGVAERAGQRQTALALALQAASCRLAQFLINPGDIAGRRAIYASYASAFAAAGRLFDVPVQTIRIPLREDTALAAHLHLPVGPGPHPTVVIFAGLGSCKEEMNTLARFMVERGVAAVVPDMPGNGESLFTENLTCGSASLTASFRAVADFVEQHEALDASRFGAAGLCMGGGYAYRACFEERRFRFCATLFPLFIDAAEAQTPQWMKSGPWYDLQTGGKSAREFLAEVGWQDHYVLECPFFMIHSRHDNWMTLESAMRLYDNALSSQRELLIVDEEPAYSEGEGVTHTMPVGEQMIWVGRVLADWIAKQTESVA